MSRKNQAGQALAFTALAMVALLGFVGLGIDMGMMRYQKRLQQTAADAAAIAGATDLCPSSGCTNFGGVQTASQSASGTNGFTDNTGGGACTTPPTNLAVGSVTVTICNPPSTGPHTGNSNYVEAFVSAGQPTYFMQVFGVTGETITARAVATNFSGATLGSTATGCVYTLGPPNAAIEGVNINGSAVLNATSCGILDNGNFNTKGSKLIVNAGSFGVSGDPNQTGSGGTVTCSSGQTSCPTYGVPATTDPLASLAPPCSPCSAGTYISIDGNGNFSGSGASNVSYNSAAQTYTIQPGTYSGINISGTGGGNKVNFAPGTYIIDGTTGCNASCVSIPGNATITGTDVFFYFTNTATWQTNGTPQINLTAPSSGTYQGILMFQDPNDTNIGPNPNGPTLGGNNTSTYSGILYFPNDQVTFYGNNTTSGSGLGVGVVIAYSISLSGNPTVNLLGASSLPGGSLPPGFTVGNATLVE